MDPALPGCFEVKPVSQTEQSSPESSESHAAEGQ